MEMVVVISGSRDGGLMIWWDGGPAFKLLHKLQKKHKTSIEEVLNYFSLIVYLLVDNIIVNLYYIIQSS